MSRVRLPQTFVTEGKGLGNRYLLPDAVILSVERELNGVGNAKVWIDPLGENATEIKLSERELEVHDGDDVLHVGSMRDLDGDAGGLTLSSDGLMDYFRYRYVLTGNLLLADMEQLSIASTLVNYAQNDAEQGTNADLNIDIAGYGASGIIRTREYVSERKHNLFEALSEFPTLENGFDMEIATPEPGDRVWTPYYPNKGTVKDIPLEYGREIIYYTYKESARKQATKVAATGGVAEQVNGERIKMEYTYEDVVASAKYGVHVNVLPSGARSDAAWLESRAKRAVASRKAPIYVPEITLKDASAYRGLLDVGDSVPVTIDHGRVQVRGTFRIQKWVWEPPTDTLKLTFLEPISE